MPTAEHDYRIAWRAAVRARAQSPPHAKRICNRDPRAALEQPLDKAFSRLRLSGAGRTDNRDPVVKRFSGKTNRERILAGARN
jgi:hypothetical protein